MEVCSSPEPPVRSAPNSSPSSPPRATTAVARADAETRPEVIVHQLTALKGDPGLRDLRNPDRIAAMTNRLRTEGTDHLLAAGRAAGIRRFVAQSVVAIGTYARTGGPVKTEDDPLDLDLPPKGAAAPTPSATSRTP
jgi:nucleoside-diphosphate-sugar epimerase